MLTLPGLLVGARGDVGRPAGCGSRGSAPLVPCIVGRAPALPSTGSWGAAGSRSGPRRGVLGEFGTRGEAQRGELGVMEQPAVGWVGVSGFGPAPPPALQRGVG